ncbi:MAG TPA: glycogen debranching N-terminal domain-containing protein [Microlunatus sp.]|nr:glycogen debranching N-terminal domain-containing protein [Microlunatus sp.]
MPQSRQPFLHDLVCDLAAPTQAWSASSGDIGRDGSPVGAQGVLHADVRVLSVAELLGDGHPLEHIATVRVAAGTRFTSVFRDPSWASGNADEMVRIDRSRVVAPGRVGETVSAQSPATERVSFTLTLRIGYDLAAVEQLKVGTADPAGLFSVPVDGEPLRWGGDDVTVTLDAPGATVELAADGHSADVSWLVTVEPGTTVSIGWSIAVTDQGAVVVPAQSPGLDVAAAVGRLLGSDPSADPDKRLRPWLERSLQDLNALRMATRERPLDAFFAAGAPWYLTLFGRDSLWTARMVLPVDPAPAVGTLRTLARLAGTTIDPQSAQEPGKIMHELRRGTYTFGTVSLPPLYYGTIDATPLWVCLLHDLRRTGDHDEVVGELLDPLVAALDWIVDHGDADGDGFLEYIDSSGHGLANQGWKDSADSVRFSDGRIAEGPVALCEVQGYAYEALIHGSDLLEAYGRDGTERYRARAADLAERFRLQFWCGEGEDRYPALALDGGKRRVDALTSNIGHLLGTGLLDAAEERLVAARIAGPQLDSGLGLRTMSSSDGGYNPLSYHCGSVWPHDTAIVIAALHRAGLVERAAGLVEGLLRASMAFDQRLPELWSGEGLPVPYPASCRPQAWSAAAAVVVAQAMTAQLRAAAGSAGTSS